MNFWDYQAKKAKVDKVADPSPTIPEIKIDEPPPRPDEIEVVESNPSDTFIGRLDARIRKLWGKE